MKQLAILMFPLALIRCSGESSPTESSNSERGGCAALSNYNTVLNVPPSSDVTFAMVRMRDLLRAAVESGTVRAERTPDWSQLPSVEWRPTGFWVDNASYVNASGQQVTGGACAAGMTLYDARKIVVSTHEPARTIPLVSWETANYFLLAIGRSDLTDSWQAGKG